MNELKTVATATAHFAMARNFHVGGSLSPVEFLTALYFSGDHHLDVTWRGRADRDKYIHSKGHTAAALWFSLWLHGYLGDLSLTDLSRFGSFGHRLPRIPQRDIAAGIEMTTGSLGQGLSFGLGLALADRRAHRPSHTFVLLGDAECNEGQVWEAAQTAVRLGLANVTVVIDGNGFGSHMTTDRDLLTSMWEGFGWAAKEVDGHDLEAVCAALAAVRTSAGPNALVLRTEKGHGLHPPFAGTPNAGGAVAPQFRPTFSLTDEVASALTVVGRRFPSARSARMSVPHLTPTPSRRSPTLVWDPALHRRGDVVNTKSFAQELVRLVKPDSDLLVASPDAIRNSGLLPLLERDGTWTWDNPSSVVLEHAIAEQDLASLAAGATSIGLRAVVFLMEGFVWRMLDSLRQSICFPALPVIVVGTSAGVGEDLGPMAQSDSCFAALSSMHGWTIFEAYDINEAKVLFNEALAATGPTYLRLPTEPMPVHADLDDVLARDTAIGAWVMVDHDKPDLVLLTAGSMVPTALIAASELKDRDGLSARVLNVFSVTRLAAASQSTISTLLPPGVPAMSLHNAPPHILGSFVPRGSPTFGLSGYGYCGGPPSRLYEASGLGVLDVLSAAREITDDRACRARPAATGSSTDG
ncbi:transketolase-like TK C-terminal-containing protein [Kribbella steppae]|nr:thiamine pyrophosphate-dependent enzyme [Kribbella steppae]